jgi:hypothetical protein
VVQWQVNQTYEANNRVTDIPALFQILQSFHPPENQQSQMISTLMQGQEEYVQIHPELKFKKGKY